MRRGRRDDARAILEQAITYGQASAQIHGTLAILAALDCDYRLSESHYISALESDPNDMAALCNFADMLKDIGHSDEAHVLLKPAADGLPDDIVVQWTMATLSNYLPHLSPQDVADHHRSYGDSVCRMMNGCETWPACCERSTTNYPLRVGFLSPDMREHSVASFLLPLLTHLDRHQVQPFAYSLATQNDEITKRFVEITPDFITCANLTDPELVARVRADDLDILVDCGGLFAGGRPGALAQRMAPVQATWLGYPNTTGLPNVDYRLIDLITDPVGTDSRATETLERIDECFLCWESRHQVPLPDRSDSRPLTFGSFNALSKIHDDLIAVWAQLMSQVPDSRFLMKSTPLVDPDVADDIAERFQDHGISRDRLDLRGRTKTQRDHLSNYGLVDIALDTFPYNGTTTTCEALWMGTPVVALAGEGHPARVGMSLLRAAGCENWIGESREGYIHIAKTLALDRDRLHQLHGELRNKTEHSVLCDAESFARRFVRSMTSLIEASP